MSAHTSTEQPGTEVAERPKCNCGRYLEIRAGNISKEQSWCGTWYDHPIGACEGSPRIGTVLYPSRELEAQTAGQRAAA
jgi:hypothetical protein